MRCNIYLNLLIVLDIALAISFSGSRLLVVTDHESDKGKYSKLFADLDSRGYKTSFESAKNENWSLFRLGERLYDHLLILPTTSRDLGPNLTPQSLVNFIGSDGNIIAVLSVGSTPAGLSSFLSELEIYLPSDRDSVVVDHFNYDKQSSPEKHDTLLISAPDSLRPDLRNYFGGNDLVAVPKAVGQILGASSPLIMPILQARSTAYCYNTLEEADVVEEPFGIGQQLSLISAMQARNSARVVVVGSAEMIEDAWFDATVMTIDNSLKGTGNRDIMNKVFSWAFKELGVIKSGGITHHLYEESSDNNTVDISHEFPGLNPRTYRIKNDISISIEISEYLYDRMIPYLPPIEDAVQVEVTMLHPFHRLSLEPILRAGNSSKYMTTLRLPDQHGIYNIRVNYKRPYYTYIDEKVTVTVRHIAHNEWPRSFDISGSLVWVGGIWITIVSWIAFILVWLFSGSSIRISPVKFT